MALYHLGVDSTDSAEMGMCTTYLGALLLEEFSDLDLVSPPELVRLNPNVPWKTRGNGAVAIRMEGPEGRAKSILERASDITEELSVLEDPQTNPGLAVLEGEVPKQLNELYHEALHRIVEIEKANEIAGRFRIPHRTWKSGRGLIGALSAIGFREELRTYETILYRPHKIKNRNREVDIGSLMEAAKKHETNFFNLDERRAPVCIPHSPCPVILGIRGTDPENSREAALSVEAENVERWVLWSTNQHTDSHMEAVPNLERVPDHSSITTMLKVTEQPVYTAGGHLQFRCQDQKGNEINCAAYEPTKGFRKSLSGLVPGDKIRVWGGVRPSTDTDPRTINLERVRIMDLKKITKESNPICTDCGSRLESMGKGQGMRCKSCRRRYPRAGKISREIPRDIKESTLEPPVAAWRHLFRPQGIDPRRQREIPGRYWGSKYESDQIIEQ